MQTPKKSLGQHWLEDEKALEYIAAVADVDPEDTVLEIGPGPGGLTKHLIQQAKKVVAIELDANLAHELKQKIPYKKLEVIEADVLKFDLQNLPTNYKVVANIPYYLTSNLLRVLCESPNPPLQVVLLIQKEVAERVAAVPGKMSILAVSVQLYYESKLGAVVPAKMFTPPPKVDSQVIILTRRKEPLFKDLDHRQFFRIVKAGFSEKRKKLRSSLSGGLGISKDEADMLLNQAEINGDLRAEALSLAQWHRLYIEFQPKKDLRSLL
jgi:16S rRNA (adenine1518-N6/adenine1519-N6)-dimethyltransferase